MQIYHFASRGIHGFSHHGPGHSNESNSGKKAMKQKIFRKSPRPPSIMAGQPTLTYPPQK